MSDIIRREEFGDVVVLHILTTSVDAISAAAIAAECQEMRPITVLDFSEVSFINSAGISALLKFVVSARKSGYQLFAMNVTPHHQKIFKMVEMSRYMPTIDERDLAAYR
ncbi:MAG TPA: anti-sigma factor antagonist [Chloroflexus aurantiacus]|jgi:anti-anti-sigma factor|uniref:Sulfate transporter/antisigma-factor antagonist STAS n=1 Tax=Chloroflexus aurantiacus (strain ATCC 29366 / DSM 635 / J-10-fl) TaxID=324602 RepID=A9WBT5_CHLAA|nr:MULTISPECIES: STAS domain-containing protein [Chloroflexus]ABY34892.1 Sulfate transporter/antisigma-factor antagonist STAS [Chloroflexus aurantiacus J-10-fl]RMG46908.1 MAG: anti-sigma factor antagonist [Chloroflexota bacterium]GIV92761.1 MAG: anti-sigma factor antagonist [Chloroflexus sp.]HBW69026.1 anti-sigma factor antagonist [Chloroflexus aurantiacus]